MLDIAPTGKGGEGVGDQGAGYLEYRNIVHKKLKELFLLLQKMVSSR